MVTEQFPQQGAAHPATSLGSLDDQLFDQGGGAGVIQIGPDGIAEQADGLPVLVGQQNMTTRVAEVLCDVPFRDRALFTACVCQFLDQAGNDRLITRSRRSDLKGHDHSSMRQSAYQLDAVSMASGRDSAPV
jgi:hypothetical protein